MTTTTPTTTTEPAELEAAFRETMGKLEAAMRQVAALAPDPQSEPLDPIAAALMATRAALNTFGKHKPADMWERNADTDEPIYRLTHDFIDLLALRHLIDAPAAHACVPALLWTTHPPNKYLIAKNTYDHRHWWADRFREHPYTVACIPSPRPEGELTLYRGAPADRADGLSWTPGLSLAARYGPIWTVTVPAAAILNTYIDRHTELVAHVVAPEYLAEVAPAGAVAAPFEAAQAAWLRERGAAA